MSVHEQQLYKAGNEAMQAAFSRVNSTKVRAYLVLDASGHVYGPDGKPIWAHVRVPEERDYFHKRVRGGAVIWGRKLWERVSPAFGEYHMDVVLSSDPEKVFEEHPAVKALKPDEEEPFMAAHALTDVVDFFFQRSNAGLWVVGGIETLDRGREHVGEVQVLQLKELAVPGSFGRPAILDELGGRYHHVVTKDLVVARSRPAMTQSVWSVFAPPEVGTLEKEKEA